jgi:hypothetical protein
MRKIFALCIALSFLAMGCAPKARCGGTKKQANKRSKKMQSFAPGMVY